MSREIALVLALLATPAVGAPAAGADETPAPTPDPVHVVKPGDTLWRIALNLSGNANRWPELYRANRDQIKDPSMLYPGQRLAIPDFTAETPRAVPDEDADDGAEPPREAPE